MREARSLRRDRAGQMMILAGLVLVIAFAAVTAMTARVNQLSSQIGQEQETPILLAADAAARGMDRNLVVTGRVHEAGSANFTAALNDALDHMTRLANGQGFALRTTAASVCTPAGADASWTTTVTLAFTDGTTSATVPVERTHLVTGGSC